MSPRILDPQEVAVGNPGGQEHIIRAVNIREHPDGFRRDRPLLSHWPPLCRGLEEGAGGVIGAGTAQGAFGFIRRTVCSPVSAKCLALFISVPTQAGSAPPPGFSLASARGLRRLTVPSGCMPVSVGSDMASWASGVQAWEVGNGSVPLHCFEKKSKIIKYVKERSVRKITLEFLEKASIINLYHAGVMELVDVADSKSAGGDTVWVRVPPPAPK